MIKFLKLTSWRVLLMVVKIRMMIIMMKTTVNFNTFII